MNLKFKPSVVVSDSAKSVNKMSLVLYLIVGAIALVYYFIKKQYSYWSDRGFVSPPTNFPFGTMKGVGREVNTAEGLDRFFQMYKGKSPAIGMFLFMKPSLLITDPELLKNIMVRDFASFHDRGMYYNKEDDPLSAKYCCSHYILSIIHSLFISVYYRCPAKNGENEE